MKINKVVDQKKINPRKYAHRLMPDEEGGYTASITEFPGCFSEGNTAQEAVDNLDNAATAWIEAAIASGYHVREPIDFNGCNGKVALRIPRTLHKQALEIAELEGCSLNQMLTTAIASFLGEKRLFIDLNKSINSVTVNTLQFTFQNKLTFQVNVSGKSEAITWIPSNELSGDQPRTVFVDNNKLITEAI